MIRSRHLRSRLRRLLPRSASEIDVRIARLVGRRRLRRFRVHVKDWPGYRYVDVHRAADDFLRRRGELRVIESEHPDETLNDILHTRAGPWTSRRIKGSTRAPWPVGPGEAVHLPADLFWVSRPPRRPG
jgi:hypothetical protein